MSNGKGGSKRERERYNIMETFVNLLSQCNLGCLVYKEHQKIVVKYKHNFKHCRCAYTLSVPANVQLNIDIPALVIECPYDKLTFAFNNSEPGKMPFLN